MIAIDRQRFEAMLKRRGMSISVFADRCGISRQSLYNMFQGKSIFSTTFEKVLKALGVDFEEIVARPRKLEGILERAPAAVQKAVLSLEEFATEKNADLFLIGSRARGKRGVRADWDFGIFFPSSFERREFVKLKQRVEDTSFPHRVDVVNLGEAPEWFLSSASKDAVRVSGTTPHEMVFSRRRIRRSAA